MLSSLCRERLTEVRLVRDGVSADCGKEQRLANNLVDRLDLYPPLQAYETAKRDASDSSFLRNRRFGKTDPLRHPKRHPLHH